MQKFKGSVPFKMGAFTFIQVGTVKTACLFLLPWGSAEEIKRSDKFLHWLNEYDANVTKAVAIALRKS